MPRSAEMSFSAGRASNDKGEGRRCLDTAELLGLAGVSPLSNLNFLFQRPKDRTPYFTALRRFLADQLLHNGPLVLVTHQVTVTALTGVFPNSGEGVVAR